MPQPPTEQHLTHSEQTIKASESPVGKSSVDVWRELSRGRYRALLGTHLAEAGAAPGCSPSSSESQLWDSAAALESFLTNLPGKLV